MKKLTLAICVFAIFGGASAIAEEGGLVWSPEVGQQSPSDLPAVMTPDMWFYLHQLERHDDPDIARRKRAEEIAAQRRLRIESRKWYGVSNARPTTSAMPFTDEFSAHWGSNTSNRYRWVWTGDGWSKRMGW